MPPGSGPGARRGRAGTSGQARIGPRPTPARPLAGTSAKRPDRPRGPQLRRQTSGPAGTGRASRLVSQQTATARRPPRSRPWRMPQRRQRSQPRRPAPRARSALRRIEPSSPASTRRHPDGARPAVERLLRVARASRAPEPPGGELVGPLRAQGLPTPLFMFSIVTPATHWIMRRVRICPCQSGRRAAGGAVPRRTTARCVRRGARRSRVPPRNTPPV